MHDDTQYTYYISFINTKLTDFDEKTRVELNVPSKNVSYFEFRRFENRRVGISWYLLSDRRFSISTGGGAPIRDNCNI